MQNVEIGVLRELGVTKVNGSITIWYSTYDFLFDFNRKHVFILYRFHVIANYLSKVAYFNLPDLHLAPHKGDQVQISPRPLASVN